MGDIVVFGRDDRRVSGGAGAFVPGAGAAVGGYKSEGKAVVVLDYRIVDVETSEVVASGEARGESKRTSKGAGVAFLAGGVFGGGGHQHGQFEFRRNHYRRGDHGCGEQTGCRDQLRSI